MARAISLAVFLILSAFISDSAVQAHSSGHPTLSGWLRKVTAASSDGGWLWGWAWGADSTVSVVERSPPVYFTSRPASFGPLIEEAVNGYGIPMSAFTEPCPDDKDGKSGGGDWPTGLGEGLVPGKNVGCPKLCLSAGHDGPEPSESWIAIVQRGQCQFVEKVREAQRFGARAVVVGGDDPEESGNADTLVNMYSQGKSRMLSFALLTERCPGDASDVKVPATFIKFSDYVRLSNLIAASNTTTSGIRTVSLQITTDYASWEWYS